MLCLCFIGNFGKLYFASVKKTFLGARKTIFNAEKLSSAFFFSNFMTILILWIFWLDFGMILIRFLEA